MEKELSSHSIMRVLHTLECDRHDNTEEQMGQIQIIAVPSVGQGGLDSERSGHFGHCDCFTVVHADGDEIVEIRTVANPPHEEGGCLRPVNLLASEGVNALVVAGMGARPLIGFNEAGIDVYFENQTPNVGAVISALLVGDLPKMQPEHACGGH